MNIKQLKEAIKDLPDEMEVDIFNSDEGEYMGIDSAEVIPIKFEPDDPEEEWPIVEEFVFRTI